MLPAKISLFSIVWLWHYRVLSCAPFNKFCWWLLLRSILVPIHTYMATIQQPAPIRQPEPILTEKYWGPYVSELLMVSLLAEGAAPPIRAGARPAELHYLLIALLTDHQFSLLI